MFNVFKEIKRKIRVRLFIGPLKLKCQRKG